MIYIVLSTYNGALYLEDFLISLEMQSCQNWKLLARDDGSKDETLSILQNFANKVKKVEIISSNTNIGVKASFAYLVERALDYKNCNYMMFADQDDVWNADKIEKTFHKMQELRSIYWRDMPLLVHSDLTVVDENLEAIAPSFWKYQNINPNKQKLFDFLVDNNVTGCTVMINLAFAEKVKTIPKEAILHDWWIAMVASAFGKIAYINEPLILYRQHEKNDTGAKQYGLRYFIKKFFSKPSFAKYIQQSKAFLALYGQELDEYHKLMLEEFSSFDGLSKFQKLKVLFKYKIWKNGFMRNLGLIFFV